MLTFSAPKSTRFLHLNERCNSAEMLAEALGAIDNPKTVNLAITLNDNTELVDEDLTALYGFSNLTKLHLCNTNITGSCLEKLLAGPSLIELNISDNPLLKLDLVQKLISMHLPNSQLQKLYLGNIPFSQQQQIAIVQAAFQNPSLNYLQIGHYNDKFSLETLRRLYNRITQANEKRTVKLTLDSPSLNAFEAIQGNYVKKPR